MLDPILPPVITSRLRQRTAAVLLALSGGLGLGAEALGAEVELEPDDPILQILRDRGHIGADQSASTTMRDESGQLVLAALNFIDTPYRFGGQRAETGFDCSGFTRHVFSVTLGLRLPRRADEQAHDGQLESVSRHALQPGDLVFFNTLHRAYSHVGIYIGDGRFIHAPRTGAQVRIEQMNAGYWDTRFDGARRAATGSARPAPTL